jgi:hypothetical protein
MKQFACKLTSVVAVAFAMAVAQKGFAMGNYDFEQAWKYVAEAQRKGLPRTVTNKLEEIGREAAVAARWPEAARAFLVRENAMKQFRDEQRRGTARRAGASREVREPSGACVRLERAVERPQQGGAGYLHLSRRERDAWILTLWQELVTEMRKNA